jgi:hypothetical protein
VYWRGVARAATVARAIASPGLVGLENLGIASRALDANETRPEDQPRFLKTVDRVVDMVADELSGPVSSRRVGSVTTSARRIMWTWSQAAWHRGSARESDAKRVEVLHSGVAHDGDDRRPGTELGCESQGGDYIGAG